MSAAPTVGSLFSGIGGLDLGLERAGFRVLWQCEANPFCREVLAAHWPGVPCFDSVESVDESAPPVEVICGGFPCQPVSVAGHRRGQDDDRWLWPEMGRIIRVLRPRIVIVENVPGLTVRGMGDVLGDLAQMRYDARWDCIPAAYVGAPHLRYRIFIVAHAQRDGLREQPDANPWGLCAAFPGDYGTTGPMADPEGLRRTRGAGDGSGGQTTLWNETGDFATDRGALLAHPAGLGLQGHDDGGGRIEHDCAAEPDGGRAVCACGHVADPHGATGRAEGGTGQAVLGPGAVGGPGRRGGRDGHSWATEPGMGRVANGVPRRVDRLKALGNAVVPQVAELVGRRILEGTW